MVAKASASDVPLARARRTPVANYCSGAARTRRSSDSHHPDRGDFAQKRCRSLLRCAVLGPVRSRCRTEPRPAIHCRVNEIANVAPNGTFPASGDFQRGAVIFRTESSGELGFRLRRSVWSESCPVSSSMRLHGGTKAREIAVRFSPGALSSQLQKGVSQWFSSVASQALPPCAPFLASLSFIPATRQGPDPSAHESREDRPVHSEATKHPADTEPAMDLTRQHHPTMVLGVRCRGARRTAHDVVAAFRKRMGQQDLHAESGRRGIRLGTWWMRDGLLQDFWISIYRVTVGWLLSAVIALPLGLLIGSYRPIQAFFEPLTDFIRYMPAVAFIPLVMLWIGIDESSKIAIIFIGTFFQLVLMAAEDIRRVPMQQIEAAQTMGAAQGEILSLVILESAKPALLDTLRVTMGWAWTYLVVAELVAANSGLGYAILKAQRFLQTDKIFGGILLIGAIGLAMDQAFRALHRRAFPWLHTK